MQAMDPAPRRAALAFIFVTVVLDILAMGIVIPVLPQLVLDFVDSDTSRAAAIYGIFGTVWALMQFVSSPILGAVSDRYGRRPVILLSNFGLGFDYILMALAPTLSWLFVGRVISGITAASFSAASAYVADVTPPEKRAAGFGMLGAAFGLGFVLGPAIGGLLGSIDPRLPFWGAAALTLLNATYGLFILPESLPVEKRAPFEWRRANPVGSLALLRSHPELFGLAGVFFLYHVAHQSLPSVFVLYADYRYDWKEAAVGLALAAVGVCSMVVQGALVGPSVARLGERRALLVGLAFGTAGFAIYGLAPTGALFLVGVPVMALMGLFNPAVQGLMTQHVQATEQGQLQGALTALMGITGLVGPALFTQTLAVSIDPERGWNAPGAAMLLAAGLLAAAMIQAAMVTRAAPTRAAIE